MIRPSLLDIKHSAASTFGGVFELANAIVEKMEIIKMKHEKRRRNVTMKKSLKIKID